VKKAARITATRTRLYLYETGIGRDAGWTSSSSSSSSGYNNNNNNNHKNYGQDTGWTSSSSRSFNGEDHNDISRSDGQEPEEQEAAAEAELFPQLVKGIYRVKTPEQHA
jgi:hypothetical protein